MAASGSSRALKAPRRECILPSGTVEIVVNLRDDHVRIEGTVRSAEGRTVSGVAVSGTYTSAFIIDARQHAAMMSVHFRPGACIRSRSGSARGR